MSTAPATIRYRVDGMDCAACAAKITNAVRRVPGVTDVSVSVTPGTMTVAHEDALHLGAAVIRRVNGLGGYSATSLAMATKGSPVGDAGSDGHGHNLDRGQDHGHDHAHVDGHAYGHSHGAGHAYDHGAPLIGPWWRGAKTRLTAASGLAFVLSPGSS